MAEKIAFYPWLDMPEGVHCEACARYDLMSWDAQTHCFYLLESHLHY
jgi:hypothetical protein